MQPWSIREQCALCCHQQLPTSWGYFAWDALLPHTLMDDEKKLTRQKAFILPFWGGKRSKTRWFSEIGCFWV